MEQKGNEGDAVPTAEVTAAAPDWSDRPGLSEMPPAFQANVDQPLSAETEDPGFRPFAPPPEEQRGWDGPRRPPDERFPWTQSRASPSLATSAGTNAATSAIGHRERMRDKLLTRGPDALADYELLEMLLFLAFKQGDTKPLAKSLIARFGSYAQVLAAPADALMAVPGIGRHAASAIKLAQASALRLARAEILDQPVLDNWDRLTAYLTAILAREKVEQFRVLYLDSRNRLVADEAQAKGTVNHTPVYPREVVKRALELNAAAMILVHNHPSGDPTPSPADRSMTRLVKEAAGHLSIVLHDHLIIGNGRITSFRKDGLL